jgi:KipI family sensor histidine kinase inhibitor
MPALPEETRKVAARFLNSGDTALLVEFGDRADRRLSALVLALDERLAAAKLPGVVETVPTLRSLTVHYDPAITTQDGLRARIQSMLAGLEGRQAQGRSWTIPVCYDPAVGPDVDDVAKRTGRTTKGVAELHASVCYRVYMLGFLPGQPYMGDLPDPLHLPRRENPRTAVPPGSVAVATTMTTIYPLESPGGWHLIGRTPVRLFDASSEHPVLLGPADDVTFKPIPLTEFERLDAAARDGDWRLHPEGAAE